MTIIDLLSRARNLGINLWVDGDNLRYSAPKGVLTQELRAELVARKPEILTFLRETHVVAPFEPDEAMPEMAEAYIAPRTPTEKALAGIWAEVLRVERVGIHDNFFELGGDSLQGIQVIARARQAGLSFSPGQILENQTIAELAAVEGTILVSTEQGVVTGAVPLVPDQRWFLNKANVGFTSLHWWNVGDIFEVDRSLDFALLKRVVGHLLVHHDALRMRFIYDGSDWRQFIPPPDRAVPITAVDLSELPKAERTTAVELAATRAQSSLSLSEGPLLRVALFELGPHEPRYLLVTIHHLVSDQISFQILREDFEIACRQLLRGELIELLPKTTSFKEWAIHLNGYEQSVEFRQQAERWLALPWAQVPPLPVDFPKNLSKNVRSSHCSTRVSLSITETEALLRGFAGQYDIMDVLLTALVQAVTQWSKGCRMVVQIVDSGRNVDIPGVDVDLSRTVGWISIGGLLLLERPECSDPLEAVESVSKQLRRFPKYGIPMEWLNLAGRHPKGEFSPNASDLLFNYHGQLTKSASEMELALLRRSNLSWGDKTNPSNPRFYLVDCSAFIVENCLTLTWGYSKNIHRRSTIESLADNYMQVLKALIACTIKKNHP
jgi:non-ribosomal peptide synthase protein (TIGR01720 family)